MDHSGCVQTCTSCHQFLLQQWDTLQKQNVPHHERHYRLRKHSNTDHYSPMVSQRPLTSSSSPHSPSPMQSQMPSHPTSHHHSVNFICFLCGQDFPWNQRRVLYSGPNSEGEPPLHFLERVKPSRGALPLSSTGEALTCSSCYKAAHKQRHAYVDSLRNNAAAEDYQQNRPQPHHQPHHSYNHKSQEPERQQHHRHSREEPPHKFMCQICRQLVSRRYVKFVRNLPESGKPCCPALVQNEEEGYSICSTCYNTLVARWESLEESRNIHKHYSSTIQNENNVRKLSTHSSSSDIHRNGGSSGQLSLDVALRIKVPTPDHDIRLQHSQSSHNGGATLLTTINNRSGSPVNLAYSHLPPSEHGTHFPSASKPTATSASNVLDLSGPARTVTVPSDSSSSHKHSRKSSRSERSHVCYVCGHHIKSSRSYTVRSYPLKSIDNPEEHSTPFFPFLTLHLAPPEAEPLTEEGTVNTCVFCYHSLMEQWNAYESTRNLHDRNPWSRQYNCQNYVCFVCGVTTYRKRIESIRVSDFTFLMDHPRPLASLVLDGGKSVVVCLVCFDTLNAQWQDFERMKVPLELRKYNLIATPPPPPPEPENVPSRHQRVNGEIRASEKNEEGTSSPFQENSTRHHHQGLGLSSKSPIQMPPTSSGKSNSSMIVGPSSHHAQASPGGSAGLQSHSSNARTSSFAAALRKLAEQATDPVTDKELSPVSPANSPAPTSASKRGPPSLVLIGDSHSSTAVSHIPSVNFTSPPTVSMAPTPTYIDGRKSLEKQVIGHSRSSSKNLYEDSKKSSYSSHRPHGDPGLEDNNRPGSSSILNRGCPPPLYGDRVDINPSPAKTTASSYLTSHNPIEAKSSVAGFYGDRNREEHSSYLSSRQSSTQPLHLRSHHTPISTSSRLDDHLQVNSSFQPYRPSPEDLRHGISPHVTSSYDSSSPYGYQAFLPHQLQHPSFRIDDPLYFERCSMLRPPLFPLPHPGVLPPHHALSFFSGSRYPPDLLSHSLSLISPTGSQLLAQDRLKLEEQQRRERPFELFDQERSRGREREREREREQEREAEYDAINKEQDKRQRSAWNFAANIESSGGTGSIGSITQGIPRADLSSRSSPVRQLNPSPSRSTSTNNLAELPRQISRHSKSPAEVADKNDGRNSFHTKAIVPSAYNRERSPITERDHYLNRASKYETNHFDAGDGDALTKKSAKSSSGSRTKDSLANSVTHSLNAADNNYSKTNHVVSEITQMNTVMDPSRMNVSSVIQPTEDNDGARKGAAGITFHSNVINLEGPSVENENRAIVRTNSVENGEVVRAWQPYLRSSPVPREQLRMDKYEEFVITSKTHPEPSDNCDKVKSKLDLAAERVKLKRLANEEDVSDTDENDDCEELDKYEKLIISKGPPMPLDKSPEKLNFLSLFGLTTTKQRREMELDIFLNKQLKMKLTTRESMLRYTENEKEAPTPWFLEDSNSKKSLTDKMRCVPDFSQKVKFFLNLNLNLVTVEQRDDKEKILQAVIHEKIRRNGLTMPCHLKAVEAVTENNSSTTVHEDITNAKGLKRKSELDSDHSLNPAVADGSSVNSDNPKLSSLTQVDSERLNSGKSHKKPRLENNAAVNSVSSTSNVVSSQYKLGRDFAQEFHESVWQQTKEISKKTNVEPENCRGSRNCASEPGDISLSSNTYTAGSGSEMQTGWPGIEMLISAYQKHQQEQKLEQEVLSEQCSRLVEQNQELNAIAGSLNQKVADYISLKTRLDERRRCIQQAIDNLKCFLKDLQ